ncbi:hypothetical protein RB653_001275 [Dictyostelium firmibasis]|uniref:Ankyrin repeat-containing protein n=1 Tax=Dictyostelium firmibasis TaxID=79012 RepID=A0AAN7TWN2_9MYCE
MINSKLNKEQSRDIQELIQSGKLKKTKIDADIEEFLQDVVNNRINKIRETLEVKEKRDKLLNSHDAAKRTAVLYTAYHNYESLFDLLVSYAADINIADFEGYTPLMKAIKVGNVVMAMKLINLGCQVNTVSKEGYSPLQLAVLSNEKKIIKLLLEKKPKISIEKSESGSVLHAACGLRDLEIVNELVKSEPLLLNTRDINNMTPLHIAIAYGNRSLALELIKLGSDVNVIANDGTTPLHISTDAEDIEICKSLIEKGAVLKMDSDGLTPLLIAKQKKNKQLEDLMSNVTLDAESFQKAKESAQKNNIGNRSRGGGDERASPEALKNNGNKAFYKHEYEMALHWYQLAIDVEDVLHENAPKDQLIAHTLYSNKSACNFNLKNFEESLKDAEKSIELAPQWPKGYLRKAQALEALNRKDEAKEVNDKYEKLLDEENKKSQPQSKNNNKKK